MQNKHYHAVIVGGGLAGCCTALALLSHFQPHSIRLALIEAKDIAADSALNAKQDTRAIALSRSSFEHLSRWISKADLMAILQPINDIEVSEADSAGGCFLNRQQNAASLGYVVNAGRLQTLLYQKLSELNVAECVDWYTPDTLAHITTSTESVSLSLASGETLLADYVLACDGSRSQVRQLCQLPCQTHHFSQTAITAVVKMRDNPYANRAYERFCKTGPLAMLPLDDADAFGLVWCLPPADAELFMRASQSVQIAQVQRAFGYRAGRMQSLVGLASYPLNSHWMPQAFSHRILFLANACHTLHPVAGQGFNLAVRDLVDLCHLLTKSYQNGRLSWQIDAVVKFHQRRQADIKQTQAATEFLVSCFSNHYQPMRLLRNIGLCTLETVPPLKATLSKFAMGYRNK